MKRIADKYGWEVALLGAAWFVESMLNIGTMVAGWFS